MEEMLYFTVEENEMDVLVVGMAVFAWNDDACF